MASTTGTTLFNLDFTEIAEEAWERAGREMRTGYDLRTARRSMNLMTIEWQNRGINMWTIEPGTITLTPGLSTYPLPTDTIDLLEQVIRTGANVASTQADLNITRISVSTYATIPNKLVQGRPIQVWIQRYSGEKNPIAGKLSAAISSSATSIALTSAAGLPAFGYVDIEAETVFYQYITGNTLGGVARGQNGTTAAAHSDTNATLYWNQLPAVTVWPTPDNSQTYTFAYWRMRRVQDAGDGVEIADMNFRFLPALTAGLAYHIAVKVPELMQRVPMLKQMYDEAYEVAAGEDREKAAVRFVPRQMFIGGGTP
jgi:hypothetical protein